MQNIVAKFRPPTPHRHLLFNSRADDGAMHGGRRRGWFERAMIALADVNVMYGMPAASIELIVLEQHERDEFAEWEASLSEPLR